MPRVARAKSSNGIYHILVQGCDGESIFKEKEKKLKYLEILQNYHDKRTVKIYAYCLLTNSCHLLVEEWESSVAQFMRKVNISYVYWYNHTYKRQGPLFRDRFASEIVRSSMELVRRVRYMHQLPVRYGLSRLMSAYPWSSYRSYCRKDRRMDMDMVLASVGEENFERYMNSNWSDQYLSERTDLYHRKPKTGKGKSRKENPLVDEDLEALVAEEDGIYGKL